MRWKEKPSATKQKESSEVSMAKRQLEEKSRAEKIRARRQQSRKETRVNPFGNSASRKQAKYKAPVTIRKTTTQPVINHNRHKVNVPLKSKGAELQLPALFRFRLGWRVISGAIFLLSLAVVISFTSLNTFRVSAITLEGAERLSGEDILFHVNLMGESIITLQPEEIKSLIEKNFPGLNNVDISVGLPASISIRVVERQPLILWQFEGQSYWIDKEGVLFPPRGEAEMVLSVLANSDPPSAPESDMQGMSEASESAPSSIVTAVTRTTPEFIQGILALRDYIPQDSILQYDPDFGLGWQDGRGWLVYFGADTTDMELKLMEYETIVSTLTEQNLTPAMISLEFIDAPFYRLEY